MIKCEDCILRNGLCIGGMGMSVLDQISSELRLKKPYPSKIILGQDIFDILRQEIRRTGTVGLTANDSLHPDCCLMHLAETPAQWQELDLN